MIDSITQSSSRIQSELHATAGKNHADRDTGHPSRITDISTFSLCQLSRNRSAKQNSNATPAQKEFSGFVSGQLDLPPSFSPKHTVQHRTTNYCVSHVTVGGFNMAQSVNLNSKQITAGTTLEGETCSHKATVGCCLLGGFPNY